MKGEIGVAGSVLLRDKQIWVDGNLVFEKKVNNDADFLSAAYDYFRFSYPKFYKMDNLCKTGFIAVELLLKNRVLAEEFKAEEVGVFLSGANSSLDADMRYQASVDTAPSPALFVYTLPNVLIGELCIRHHIKGEAACFVFDIFDSVFQTRYVNSLFETGKVKCAVSGWADYFQGRAEAFFYLAETGKPTLPEHNSTNINKLYKGL